MQIFNKIETKIIWFMALTYGVNVFYFLSKYYHLCLIVNKFQFVFCPPGLDVAHTVINGCWRVTVHAKWDIKLCIISIKVVINAMWSDDVPERCCVQCEKKQTVDWSLFISVRNQRGALLPMKDCRLWWFAGCGDLNY